MRRIAIVMGTVAVAIVATAGSAWAHVTVQPSEAAQSSYATLSFKVPNESDTESTVKVVISFPKDQPIASASTQPVPGWKVAVAKTQMTTPVTSEGGDSVDQQLSTITWTADSGGGIAPGEFQTFLVSLQLPAEGESLGMPATQIYSDGEEVEWNEATPEGGQEPEHPMPMIELTPAGADPHGGGTTDTTVKADGSAAATVSADQDDIDSAKTMGTIGLVVGIVAILFAIAALVMARRKPEAT